jgi:hypothetical protein
MKEANAIRQRIKKARGTKKDAALLDVIDDLLQLHIRLTDRVAELERQVGRKAARATPGRRTGVEREVVVGRPKPNHPRRTERPTGRSNLKTTDMDRGII